MRVPLSWLAEYVDLPPEVTAREVEAALIRVGLEVEAVDDIGAEVTGPLVIGRVLSLVDEPQSNGKTIRWCQVDVGNAEPQGIVCGAANFAVGDAVVVVLPGAVLPGGFAIAARKTYGHISDGMICSVRELGIGAEHDGILVLSDVDLVGAQPGDDARAVLGLPDAVLDIAVTPDRGYCLSMRGIAREVATAFGVPFRDPALRETPAPNGDGWPVVIADSTGCDRFVARGVSGLDPSAGSPFWLRHRLNLAGMRPISLAVDITNYVMLELGQPLHGYDRDRLSGPITVRSAALGEVLETLDGTKRALFTDDLLIADDSGPIGVAGVMGGASTELHTDTTNVVVEAAHFSPARIAAASRRHKLASEASRRFDRGVDGSLAAAAADRVVELLCGLGGGVADAGVTDVGDRAAVVAVDFELAYPGRLAGVELSDSEVIERLTAVGCVIAAGSGPRRLVEPPSWRPDLGDRADFAEEVIRLHGLDSLPSILPPVTQRRGSGGSEGTGRHQRQVSRAMAGTGFVEIRTYPFLGEGIFDVLGFAADDVRRRAVRLANPMSDEEPLLRTTLIPGLLSAARRNLGRGATDLALFELGRVFRNRPGESPPMPHPGVAGPPSAAELAAMDAALPEQPVLLAALLTGAATREGWWGEGRQASWADAIEAARTAAASMGAPLWLRASSMEPWHPGRCAELLVGFGEDVKVVGYAGELHPRVCIELDLPARSSALELSIDELAAFAQPIVAAPVLSTFPVATQDVALVVDESVPAAEVESALIAGAGALLESLRLFDVYSGDQVGDGRKSLAYALRFRAPDRTLTAQEARTARDQAVAEASRMVGAVLRG